MRGSSSASHSKHGNRLVISISQTHIRYYLSTPWRCSYTFSRHRDALMSAPEYCRVTKEEDKVNRWSSERRSQSKLGLSSRSFVSYSLLKTTISRSLTCLPDRKYFLLTSHVVALFEDIWCNRQPPLYMYIQYSYCQACWFCLWLAVGVARHVDSASDWLWVWPYHAIQRGEKVGMAWK